VCLHFASDQGQWIEIGAKEPFEKCLLASNCLGLAAVNTSHLVSCPFPLPTYSVEKLGSREFASDLRSAVLATARFWVSR
jgi:hypothetical protein